MIFIFYVIFVIMVSVIGNSRGRALDGFLVSLILSPLIGLIWVMAMPNLKEQQKEIKG